jgi:molybdopterin synthase catalytic subunit
MDFCKILVTREVITPSSPSGLAWQCGAVVDFFGIVRPLEDGRRIDGIDYDAHPRMVEKELQAIVREASGLRACLLVHRIGFVPAGEISLYLRLATPHRAAAYEGSRAIVESLKRRAPIWKKPIFAEEIA